MFSRQHKLVLEWRVELALLKALGEIGRIPAAAHDAIKAVIDGALDADATSQLPCPPMHAPAARLQVAK